MSGWIRAEDLVPETTDRVLCVKQLKDGRLDMCFGYYDPNAIGWNYAENRQCFIGGRWVTSGSNNNVKYWMPLPEMPEVEA